MSAINVSVSLPGREEINLDLQVSADGQITKSKLTGVGGPKLLDVLETWRPKFSGKLIDIEPPRGADPATILMRELVLRAQGAWQFPFAEEELCHCRAIPTRVVDMAIITGAHTPEEVSRLTSASTACGTCRPDVRAIINYRLGNGE